MAEPNTTQPQQSEELHRLLQRLEDRLLSAPGDQFSDEQKTKLLRMIEVFDKVLTNDNLALLSKMIHTFEVLQAFGIAGNWLSNVIKTVTVIIVAYFAIKSGLIDAIRAAISSAPTP